jgi:hypothetical protein
VSLIFWSLIIVISIKYAILSAEAHPPTVPARASSQFPSTC